MTYIKCDFCKSEFVLKDESKNKSNIIDVDYQNRGSIYKTYLPDQWNVQYKENAKTTKSN